MKKLFAILLALTMLTSLLAACGSQQTPGTPANTTGSQQLPGTPGAADPTVYTAMGADGPVTLDYTTRGTVAENAEPLGSSKLVIGGVTYEMPITLGALLENGWTLAEGDANQTVAAGGSAYGDLVHGGTAWLFFTAKNTTDAELVLTGCTLCELSVFPCAEGEEKPDFILPGGITQGSTIADVFAVYGSDVELPSFGFDYTTPGNGTLNYKFHMLEDGTLDAITITVAE